jgi:hypothetical protein
VTGGVISDGHPGPATGISQAAGVPSSGRAEVAQQPGKHVRGSHGVVQMLGWWRGSPSRSAHRTERSEREGRRGDVVRLRLTHLPDVHTVIVIRPHLSP